MDRTRALRLLNFVLHFSVVWIWGVDGLIRCECNTHECQSLGESTCLGVKGCYTELFHNQLTKGCDPAPLACENRQPTGLRLEWPAVYCCHDDDLCNKYKVPEVKSSATDSKEEPKPILEQQQDPNCSHSSTPHDGGSQSYHQPGFRPGSQSNSQSGSQPGSKFKSGSQPKLSRSSKVINPIYIAVPVAGVCVLLALIIFAMYLLRRRTDYHHHDSYLAYHQQLAPVMTQHKAASLAGGRHLCQCTCKRQVVPVCSTRCADSETYSCNNGINRCTDSERSSSGSETRLFLQT